MVKAVGTRQRPWGRGQGLGGVAKAVRANTNPNPIPNLKAVGRSQGRRAWPRTGGVDKAVETWSRPRGGGQNLGDLAKAVGAWSSPWGR